MKLKATLKPGVSFTEALETLADLTEKEERIENDPHTNKHYILMGGRMWYKGHATGKYWELFCNSREGHIDARNVLSS